MVLDEIDTVAAHRNVGRRAELAPQPAAAASKARSLVAFIDFEYGDFPSCLAEVIGHAEADNAPPISLLAIGNFWSVSFVVRPILGSESHLFLACWLTIVREVDTVISYVTSW